jgi:hypothetical protein
MASVETDEMNKAYEESVSRRMWNKAYKLARGDIGAAFAYIIAWNAGGLEPTWDDINNALQKRKQ